MSERVQRVQRESTTSGCSPWKLFRQGQNSRVISYGDIPPFCLVESALAVCRAGRCWTFVIAKPWPRPRADTVEHLALMLRLSALSTQCYPDSDPRLADAVAERKAEVGATGRRVLPRLLVIV